MANGSAESSPSVHVLAERIARNREDITAQERRTGASLGRVHDRIGELSAKVEEFADDVAEIKRGQRDARRLLIGIATAMVGYVIKEIMASVFS